MEQKQEKSLMVLAILQGDDYEETVSEMNKKGFFVTLLSSTGGFLKKKSTTLMVAVEESKLKEVLDIIKECAGTREECTYQSVADACRGYYVPASSYAMYPVNVRVGGAVVFIMELKQMEKY